MIYPSRLSFHSGPMSKNEKLGDLGNLRYLSIKDGTTGWTGVDMSIPLSSDWHLFLDLIVKN